MITRYFVDHVTALICIVALMFEKCKMCEPLYVKPSKYGVIPSCNGNWLCSSMQITLIKVIAVKVIAVKVTAILGVASKSGTEFGAR